ncbi:glycosyltransferase [Clostridium sp. AM58-1XD]|uniref:glycosyltransferase n=1 Tax=Clostridium sp. AM58-1XD TaxID=2292307 RepID=UPI000E534AEC|nr:glycosyltransferase [Clostridium sp. AM58-1XD]RGZ00429.1 glycosyltransferase [Clostridium sp. AM58-1XD]
MKEKNTVCLMNDSFPPIIDGVANAVVNYCIYYQKNFGSAVAAVPYHPDAVDEAFPFPVIRYRSYDTTRLVRYRAGYPFSVEAIKQLKAKDPDLIHSHCPFMSTFLARTLRELNGAPIVFTYHTKFDIDIAKTVPSRTLQEQAVKMVVNNIKACDEVWAVSRGAGENLRSMGYDGDYIIMENGVDFPRGRVPEETVQAAVHQFDLPEQLPVYLFIGRMMWYKGLKLIFDSLHRVLEEGKDFRMVLIGDGSDRPDMEAYAAECGLSAKCLFLGEIRDRELLRAWYCRADLFLFPSSYDTNGLVVREAAACGLASVLIAGSCAAEGVKDGVNGFLCEEHDEALAALISSLWERRPAVKQAGIHAMNQLYLSWEESVSRAAERYEIILERAASGELDHQRRLSDSLLHTASNMIEGVERLREIRELSKEELHAMYVWQKSHLGRFADGIWEKLNNII